jgi:alpha-1,2-mannosyltransferase
MSPGIMAGFVAKRIYRASWLTARRVRIHGLLLALCLWSVYAADMATPGLRDRNGLIKGTDFLHFYALGTLALDHRGDLLYNMPAQTALLGTRVPEAAGSLYVPLYGPQVSLLFSPLARLPYPQALLAWLLLNLTIYALCCHAVWKRCSNLERSGGTVFILALAFPGLFHLLAWGQTSGLALACFTLAFLALRAGRPLAAGLVLGCLIFKPQLGLAAAVVLVLAGEWQIVLGASVGALVQLGAGWLVYGSAVMRDYFHALLEVRNVLPLLEPRPYQMDSLRAFWSLLLPWPQVAFALYGLSAAAVLALTVRCWSGRLPLELRFSALLLATVLVAPHLTVYDLVILAPAFLWLGNETAGSGQGRAKTIQFLLYLCFPLFLLGPLARVTHLQLSVMALAALLAITARPLPASLIHSPDATLMP